MVLCPYNLARVRARINPIDAPRLIKSAGRKRGKKNFPRQGWDSPHGSPTLYMYFANQGDNGGLLKKKKTCEAGTAEM